MTSENDKVILNSIFNPLLPVGDCLYEESLDHLQDEACDEDSVLSKSIKELEVEGVKAAEGGEVERALGIFDEAIRRDPTRASAYNNRAQTLRLFHRTDEAMSDLNKAIEASGGRGRAACQAFVQRGLIHRLRGHDDLAKEDFQRAADLGSQFAKTQLVQMNPYAALCNKMLHDVFHKLRKGEQY